ncbi:metallo-beta-lactamase superfamily domain-containing protein [Ditylenchus destructor]|uniref:Metallo-beta-lactamase superfamily domain-containing protein n=1 Tax=Ditylenchus destructor TaxID=166010 RepID=A0AAD4R2X8_9BILA|nr:metallo-beta-lactamase superfamily domain-containing protein [Ditylenchus destructor]
MTHTYLIFHILLCLFNANSGYNVKYNLPQLQNRREPIRVVPIIEGLMARDPDGQKINKVSSVSLVYGDGIALLVDSAAATDFETNERVLKELSLLNLSNADVRFVVTTHGHPDHFGQANFFPNADHFFGAYQNHGNRYTPTQLRNAPEMKLSERISFWSTPGHTTDCISVIVSGAEEFGTVAIVGDLFYSETDVLNSTEWSREALNPYLGFHSQNKVICTADYVIPGHSKMFRVTQEMRNALRCPNPILSNDLSTRNKVAMDSPVYDPTNGNVRSNESIWAARQRHPTHTPGDYFVQAASVPMSSQPGNSPIIINYLRATQSGSPMPFQYFQNMQKNIES